MTPDQRFVTAIELPVFSDTDPELEASLADLDDTVLLSLVRRGNQAAFGALFARYRYPAERFAAYLGLGAEAPDVVSESFAQMYDLLTRGKGPERAFRAYMFTTIRHEAGRRAKARRRVIPTGDSEDLDTAVPFGDGRLDLFEQGMVRDAYQALPERWRSVLWALDVEDRSPAEIGQAHGMSANAVSALAYRARSGLRASYLQQHLNDDNLADVCGTQREQMVSVVRGTAKQLVRERVLRHLEGCAECDHAFEHLTEINRDIGEVSMPAALTVAGTASAGIAAGFSWLVGAASTLKAQLAAALVPAVTVGAFAVAPMMTQESASASVHDPARHAVTPTSVESPPSKKNVAVAPHHLVRSRSDHARQRRRRGRWRRQVAAAVPAAGERSAAAEQSSTGRIAPDRLPCGQGRARHAAH